MREKIYPKPIIRKNTINDMVKAETACVEINPA